MQIVTRDNIDENKKVSNVIEIYPDEGKMPMLVIRPKSQSHLYGSSIVTITTGLPKETITYCNL